MDTEQKMRVDRDPPPDTEITVRDTGFPLEDMTAKDPQIHVIYPNVGKTGKIDLKGRLPQTLVVGRNTVDLKGLKHWKLDFGNQAHAGNNFLMWNNTEVKVQLKDSSNHLDDDLQTLSEGLLDFVEFKSNDEPGTSHFDFDPAKRGFKILVA